MRRAAAALLVAAAAVLALAGCEDAPSHGVIHNKDWTPGYWWTPPCFSSGKGSTCISIPEYEPARYELDVWASAKDHGWVQVDEVTYHRLAVGAYWDGR